MSDAYSVVYSPEAKADLREIYTYIAFNLQSPGAAEGQTNRIRKEIRSLDLCHRAMASWIGNPGRAWECIKYR